MKCIKYHKKDNHNTIFLMQDDWNLYGAHPVYMSLENDGKASMVFLRNSHAMGKFQIHKK